jgi:hypothetical protein
MMQVSLTQGCDDICNFGSGNYLNISHFTNEKGPPQHLGYRPNGFGSILSELFPDKCEELISLAKFWRMCNANLMHENLLFAAICFTTSVHVNMRLLKEGYFSSLSIGIQN